jgi:divalent metal cation (Fe/Co/Zn/Cd) transporter
MWLLRNTPVVGYISPVITVFVAGYLIVGCIKRIKTSLNELTDKTLPEGQQLKILKVLTGHYNSYSQVHSIDSRRIGEITRIDISLSFEDNTKVIDFYNKHTDSTEGRKYISSLIHINLLIFYIINIILPSVLTNILG